MRIRKLHLRRFGHFEDTELDFGVGGGPEVHVVYGSNEAGKSTTLDAIKYTLFGMPVGRSNEPAYDFRFAKKDIRTAIELELDDGSELAFARNRGTKVSVLDPATGDPDEARADRLAGVLAGVTRDLWVTRHGLNQEQLAAGSDALLEERATGDALFAIATGMVGARTVLDTVRARRRELLPDSERGGLLSAALTALKTATNEFTTAKRAAASIGDATAELARLSASSAPLQREFAACEVEILQVEHAREARGELAARAQLTEQIEQFTDLPSAWTREQHERFTGARDALERGVATVARLEAQRADLTGRIDEHDVDPLLVAAADRLDELHQRIGVVQAARDAAPQLRARIELETGALQPAMRDAERREIAALESALAVARRIDEEAVVREEQRLGSELAALDATAARIAPSAPTVAQLLALPVPSPAAREELEASLADVDRRVEEITATRTNALRKLDEHRGKLARLHEQAGDVPDRDSLRQLRDERDAAWREVGSAALEGAIHASDIARVATSVDTADRYADRLVDDAERVGAAAALRDLIAQDERRVATAGQQLEECERERATLLGAWERAWAPTGIDAASPQVMREFLERLRVLRTSQKALDERRVEVGARRTQLDAARRGLARATGTEAEAKGSLELDVEVAERRLDELSGRCAEHDAVAEALAGARQSLVQFEATISSFDSDVAALLAGLPSDIVAQLDAGDAVVAVRALRDRAARAATNAQVVEQLQEQLRGTRDELERVGAERAGAQALLDSCVATTGVTGLEELAAAAERWVRRSALEAEVAELDRRLLERTRLTSAELHALIGDADDADLLTRVSQARTRLESVQRELAVVDERRSELERLIGAISSDDAQATARIRQQDARAEVERLVPEYRQLVLQEHMLQGLLDEAAQRERGPMIERASTYLERLTRGRWVRIATGIDDAGASHAQVECVDGSRAEVTALSEGTRFQLFLALRLAVLVDGASRGERMPLVVDDVFLTFDDERASAAFQLLADVSQHVQIVFLTHHEHLAELATNVLDADVLRLHRLERGSEIPA